MHYVIIILQLIVGLSLLNVWVVQFHKPTRWRGGCAANIIEEFDAYGLPLWSCYVIGTLKVLLASLLIVAIWLQFLLVPVALALSFLLLGSVAMHLKIKDPLYKSFPALLFLIMCLFIAFYGSY